MRCMDRQFRLTVNLDYVVTYFDTVHVVHRMVNLDYVVTYFDTVHVVHRMVEPSTVHVCAL
jgi:hypothetical protein